MPALGDDDTAHMPENRMLVGRNQLHGAVLFVYRPAGMVPGVAFLLAFAIAVVNIRLPVAVVNKIINLIKRIFPPQQRAALAVRQGNGLLVDLGIFVYTLLHEDIFTDQRKSWRRRRVDDPCGGRRCFGT